MNYSEIEIKTIIGGIHNSKKPANYIEIDSNGFQWLTISETKRLIKKLQSHVNTLEKLRKKKE